MFGFNSRSLEKCHKSNLMDVLNIFYFFLLGGGEGGVRGAGRGWGDFFGKSQGGGGVSRVGEGGGGEGPGGCL